MKRICVRSWKGKYYSSSIKLIFLRTKYLFLSLTRHSNYHLVSPRRIVRLDELVCAIGSSWGRSASVWYRLRCDASLQELAAILLDANLCIRDVGGWLGRPSTFSNGSSSWPSSWNKVGRIDKFRPHALLHSADQAVVACLAWGASVVGRLNLVVVGPIEAVRNVCIQ